MKRIIDKNTNMFIRDDFSFDEKTEIGLQVEPSSGLYRPKWDGAKWIEGLTKNEIDSIILSYNPNFEPEKRYEIKSTEKQYLNLVIAVPDLLDYLKQSSIKVYEHENFRMFYVNSFLPGHREILTKYLGVESITDRQNGNE